MFGRFLTLWLVTCILGYGSVCAFEGHLGEVTEHQSIADDVYYVPDGDEGHPACDHCCHASAHILALQSFYTGPIYSPAGIGCTPYQQTVLFRSTAPPDRPSRS